MVKSKDMTIRAIVNSLRLRTLPLSLSGVLLGIMLAYSDYRLTFPKIIFTILTTVCLQIVSNLSNELGDVLNGTDTEERQGPKYGLNGGAMTISEMKLLIGFFIVQCVVFGLLMIYFSFGTLLSLESVLLMLLGGAAIIAALKYTLGENPYGYRGMGDLYVFLFFGIVSVLGSYFVMAHEIPTMYLLLPAASIGCFSVGVLNVNNIRDMKTDSVNRVTIPLKIGAKNAKIYHTVLIVLGWAFMIAYCLTRMFSYSIYLYFITLPLFALHIAGVWKNNDRALDKMLPMLVIITFLFSILVGLGFILYLL